MAQPFSILRVAHGNFTFPTNTSANTASTLSAYAKGAYVPKGAIVTRIFWVGGDALTNVSALKNGTANLLVGAQAIGTNNRVGSTLWSAADVAGSQAVVDTPYVSVGGPLVVNIASSDSDRSAISGDFDVYVEYLYASDGDQL